MGIWECSCCTDGNLECATIMESNLTVLSQITYINTLRSSIPFPEHIS